jgi:hypothetical protein
MSENKANNPFFILASGPSLNKEDVDAIKGKGTVIVINDNYKMAPWADYLYYCDPKWYHWHADNPEFQHFQGQIWTQDETTAKENGFNYIKSTPGEGISTDPRVIYQGSNSGFQAINLAYHLGARKIILLGYDMQLTNGQNHWFGKHPDGVISSYKNWIGYYNRLADDAKTKNLDIINCSRQTALTCFTRQPLEKVL